MKKALYNMILFAFLFAVPLSCIRENRDDCPEDGPCLILNFEYLDSLNADIYDTRIEMIDVLLFDADRQYYGLVTLNERELASRRTVIENIDAGDYYIVCWANNRSSRTDYDELNVDGDITRAYVNHDHETTADPLHYAPDKRVKHLSRGPISARSSDEEFDNYIVNVAPVGDTEHTMAFMSAHRTLEVTLVNWPEIMDDDLENPTVTVHNLVRYYDLLLDRGEESVTFSNKAAKVIDTNDRELGFAKYYLPHFDDDNPIYIQVSGKNHVKGEYDHIKINMTDVLALYDWDGMYDGDDRIIKVDIDWFDGTYVKINVSNWTAKDTDPIFN